MGKGVSREARLGVLAAMAADSNASLAAKREREKRASCDFAWTGNSS